MPNTKEIKRQSDKTDFEALILPENLAVKKNAGCLYFEINQIQFQKLKQLVENLLSNEKDLEIKQPSFEAKVNQFLRN